MRSFPMRRWIWIGSSLLLLAMILLVAGMVLLRPADTVTAQNCEKIKIGMTAGKVQAIFGRVPDERYQYSLLMGLGGSMHSGPPSSAVRTEQWAGQWTDGSDGSSQQTVVTVYYDRDNKVVFRHWYVLYPIDEPGFIERVLCWIGLRRTQREFASW